MDRRIKLGVRFLVVIALSFALVATMPINANIVGATGPQPTPSPKVNPEVQPTPTAPKAKEPASPSEPGGEPGLAILMADCNDPLQINPLSATVRNGQYFTVSVYWACQDHFDIYIHMNWGNGAYQQYRCVANCSSGSTSFSTIFWTDGPKISSANITNSSKGGNKTSTQNVIP